MSASQEQMRVTVAVELASPAAALGAVPHGKRTACTVVPLHISGDHKELHRLSRRKPKSVNPLKASKQAVLCLLLLLLLLPG
jgi:hypothetical protein